MSECIAVDYRSMTDVYGILFTDTDTADVLIGCFASEEKEEEIAEWPSSRET